MEHGTALMLDFRDEWIFLLRDFIGVWNCVDMGIVDPRSWLGECLMGSWSAGVRR